MLNWHQNAASKKMPNLMGGIVDVIFLVLNPGPSPEDFEALRSEGGVSVSLVVDTEDAVKSCCHTQRC